MGSLSKRALSASRSGWSSQLLLRRCTWYHSPCHDDSELSLGTELNAFFYKNETDESWAVIESCTAGLAFLPAVNDFGHREYHGKIVGAYYPWTTQESAF